MGDLVIIGEKLNKDLKRLISIIKLNGGCIDEIKIHCVTFLLKDQIEFKYRFSWNGFIPYSRELANQLRILVRLGLLYKNDDEYCVPARFKNLNLGSGGVEKQVREVLKFNQEELIEKAKEKFFNQ